jgi:hypothetical protein
MPIYLAVAGATASATIAEQVTAPKAAALKVDNSLLMMNPVLIGQVLQHAVGVLMALTNPAHGRLTIKCLFHEIHPAAVTILRPCSLLGCEKAHQIKLNAIGE